MRVFITINMNERVRKELENQVPALKERYKGKYTAVENWHVTMLFLGEVEDDKLGEIEIALERAGASISPFELYLEGIGAFPSMQRPKILWAGVEGELAPLQQLYQNVLKEIEALGVPFDAKPTYTPHLTLARKVEPRRTSDEYSLKTSPWKVEALELYQSFLKPEGVQYKNILHKKFGNKE